MVTVTRTPAALIFRSEAPGWIKAFVYVSLVSAVASLLLVPAVFLAKPIAVRWSCDKAAGQCLDEAKGRQTIIPLADITLARMTHQHVKNGSDQLRVVIKRNGKDWTICQDVESEEAAARLKKIAAQVKAFLETPAETGLAISCERNKKGRWDWLYANLSFVCSLLFLMLFYQLSTRRIAEFDKTAGLLRLTTKPLFTKETKMEIPLSSITGVVSRRSGQYASVFVQTGLSGEIRICTPLAPTFRRMNDLAAGYAAQIQEFLRT